MIKISLNNNSQNQYKYWGNSGEIPELEKLLENANIHQLKDFDLDLSSLCFNYSFVKFDQHTHCILAKRDLFGTIPLFFKKSGNDWSFSNNLSDLISLADKPNHFQVLSYLKNNNFRENSFQTFYTDIFQVPAGACIIFTNEKIVLEHSSYYHKKNKSEFLEILKDSVFEILKENKSIAFHVSGGIDSTGLASLAQTLKLENSDVINCVVRPNFYSTDETSFQESFEEKYKQTIRGFEPSFDLLNITKKYISIAKQPPFFYNSISLYSILLENLASNSINELVSGYGGDGVLGHGFEYFETLIKENQHIKIKEILTMLTNQNLLEDKYYNWSKFPERKKYSLTLLQFVFSENRKKFLYNPTYLYKFIKLGGNLYSLFEFGLVQIFNSKNKTKSLFKNIKMEPSKIDIFSINQANETFKNFQSVSFSNINETYSNLAKVFGVNFRFPFLNSKILNKSFEYTFEEKFGNGLGRMHFRNALEGILPEKVKNRVGKTSFDAYFVEQIKSYIVQNGEISENSSLWYYIDKKAFYKLKAKFINSNKSYHFLRQDAHYLHRILNLNIWLDENQF